MKYMCKEFIGRRELEKIKTHLDLFDYLERYEKLNERDLTFLNFLLDNCCAKRLDVIRVLQNYAANLENYGGNKTYEIMKIKWYFYFFNPQFQLYVDSE